MMNDETNTLLKQGIQALKEGRREQARELLMRVVELDERNEIAWLWLSGAVDTPRDQLVCLENVLTIIPEHVAAQRGVERLRTQHPELVAPEAETEIEPGPPSPAPEPDVVEADWSLLEDQTEQDELSGESLQDEDFQAGTKTCLACGTINPAWRDLCSACGKPMDGDADSSETTPAETFRYQGEEPDEVVLAQEYETHPQGLLTLGAAWIAALALNKRGAYEHEVFSASTRRTIVGLVVGAIAVPAIVTVLIGLVLAASNTGDIMGMVTSLAATPVMLACLGGSAIGVIAQFYLWTAGLYLMAWLLGGKASFVVHAQLLSIAYAATSLLGSLAGIVLAAGAALLTKLVPEFGLIGIVILGVVSLGIAIYSVIIHGQALAAAHRFSLLGGIGVLLLSSLLYSLLVVLVVLLILLATGASLDRLPTLMPLAMSLL